MSHHNFRYNILHLLSLVFLVLTGIFLIGLQYRIEGWVLYFFGLFSLIFSHKSFAKYFILLYVSIGLLGITPITTDTSLQHIAIMSITLGLALLVPYLMVRFVYKDDTIRYGAFLTRRWTTGERIWLCFTFIVGYLLLPYYLRDTLSYLNWTVKPGWSEIMILFLGTNALGIWDELFFVNTVLQVLRRYFPFVIANISQALLFTSFLYELGFRGWGPVMIFPFALAQGYVFRETKNLTYIISLHLALDFILFLALIYLHKPDWWVKIFFF
ncbi:MAG: hypothetical protein HHAS10_00280 [Candidatus Altimarinota bacterium]